GTLYRKCNVRHALAAGANLHRPVPRLAGAGIEVLPGNRAYPAQRLRHGRVGTDPGAAVVDRHGAGRRSAGDGDDFRLRELRLATGHRRRQGKAQLARHHGLFIAEDESRGVDRGDLLDPSAAHLHGCQERRSRAPDVVRDHSHDLRHLGVRHGLPGQGHQAL
ncbi:Putative inner membrane protein (Fragment), partial [Pseudomonas fluorescens]